jgi:hypothetical protein
MLMALFGATQGRLNDMSPRDDIELNLGEQMDRDLAAFSCAAKFKCEVFKGVDGRIIHARTPILGFFGAGCVTKCIVNSAQFFFVNILGWNCGPCGP